MSYLRKLIRLLQREEDGATAVEYAVMLSLIAAVVIVGVGQLSDSMRENYDYTGKVIGEAMAH